MRTRTEIYADFSRYEAEWVIARNKRNYRRCHEIEACFDALDAELKTIPYTPGQFSGVLEILEKRGYF